MLFSNMAYIKYSYFDLECGLERGKRKRQENIRRSHKILGRWDQISWVMDGRISDLSTSLKGEDG